MKRLVRLLKDYGRDTSGATAIEYGLVATFISIAIIASVQAVGSNLIANFYDEIVAAFGS
jgi:pilus assembly protein Flp/PilA